MLLPGSCTTLAQDWEGGDLELISDDQNDTANETINYSTELGIEHYFIATGLIIIFAIVGVIIMVWRRS